MPIVSQGAPQTIIVYEGEQITITADGVSAGTVTFLDMRGKVISAAQPVTVGSTTRLGPYVTDRQYRVSADVGTLIYTVAKVNLSTTAMSQPDTPGAVADVSLALYEDFSRYADNTAMTGQAPLSGSNWVATGANPPTILGGALISVGTGYLYSIQSAAVNEVGCDVAWTGGPGTAVSLAQLPMTLAITPDTTSLSLNNIIHFDFGPAGFNFTLGGLPGLYAANSGSWSAPMKTDGTVYRIKMAIRGNSAVMFGPNGEVFSWSDPRIAQYSGPLIFLEPSIMGDGLRSQIKKAWATSRNSNNQPSPFATKDDFAAIGLYFSNGQVVGALNKMGEVDVGKATASYFPQVQWGPQNIITSSTAAVAISATTISVVDYIPSGQSIVIDPGTNQETVTTTGVSGSGPFVLTIPALTKAHASGSIVLAQSLPASMRYTVVYNQVSQTLLLPYSVTFGGQQTFGGGPQGNGFYLDSGYAGFINYATGAVRLGAANAFATGQNVTASRPAAATVGKGAQFYDTTLNLPIWSDGTNWKNAAGTVV